MMPFSHLPYLALYPILLFDSSQNLGWGSSCKAFLWALPTCGNGLDTGTSHLWRREEPAILSDVWSHSFLRCDFRDLSCRPRDTSPLIFSTLTVPRLDWILGCNTAFSILNFVSLNKTESLRFLYKENTPLQAKLVRHCICACLYFESKCLWWFYVQEKCLAELQVIVCFVWRTVHLLSMTGSRHA